MSSLMGSVPDTESLGYSLQPQSPLFRLSRELRDLIYEAYSFEPTGCHYHYNGVASKLRTGDACPIDVNLIYTCKAIANELQGAVFRVNRITFTTADRMTEHSWKSAALRFQFLLYTSNATKWRVFLATAQCLSPEVKDEIRREHPSSGLKLLDTLERLLGPRDRRANSRFYMRQIRHNTALNDALDFALELMESHPQFRSLALRAFAKEQVTGEHSQTLSPELSPNDIWRSCVYYRPDALDVVLGWKPQPFSIPTDAELTSLESYLLVSTTAISKFVSENGPKLHRWYFSATSIAIDFLYRLNKRQRLQIRSIILNEEHKAVSSPETHARELIQYCQENRKLRVERRACLWKHILLSRWAAEENRCWWHTPAIRTELLMEPIIKWVIEADALTSLSMPRASFTLIFENDENNRIWEAISETAALQEAFIESHQRQNIDFPPPVLHPPWLSLAFTLPHHMPRRFPEVVKSMIAGDSIVQMDNQIHEQWDLGQLLSDRHGRELQFWRLEWELLLSDALLTPRWGLGTYCGNSPCLGVDRDEEEDSE